MKIKLLLLSLFAVFIICLPQQINAQLTAEAARALRNANIQVLDQRIDPRDFTLPLLGGGNATLSAYKGKVVILSFWTTWCPSCQQMMPTLDRLYQRFRNQGLEVLAVNSGENASTVQRYIQTLGYTFPVLFDSNDRVSDIYDIYYLPTTFIIDTEGKIIGVVDGGMSWDTPNVITAFETLLSSTQNTSVPEGLEWEIVNGNSVTITKYTGSATTLNIPELIQGLPVTVIGSNAFDGHSDLTSVTIPSSVTSIGSYAFSYCTSLTNITIPSSVTNIAEGAFWACDSLTSITIPSSVISIRNEAFGACSSLTNITVDDRNTVYTSLDGILFDKNMQTIVAYPIGRNANSYVIPSSVTVIGNGAFVGSRNLSRITIPSSVITIGNRAFSSCRNLTNVTIPSSVTSIESGAFNYSGLTSITIPSSVTNIGYEAFYGCSNLTNITVDNRNTVYASIDGVLFDKDLQILIDYPYGRRSETHYIVPSSVTAIGMFAFYNRNGIESITIPSSVTVIRYAAFRACYNLTNIIIPASLVSIEDYAFYDCNMLGNVTLSRNTRLGENVFPERTQLTYSDAEVIPEGLEYRIENNNSVTITGYTGSATTLDIPERIQGLPVTVIGNRAFYLNRNLINVTIPSLVVRIEGQAFYGCSNLTSIIIPSLVTTIGFQVFTACYNLENVIIPSSVTSIEDYAFWYCFSLTNINIPLSVTSIRHNAFLECRSLTSITVDNRNPSYASIDGVLFDKNIRTIITYPNGRTGSYTIPSSVTSIGAYAFWACNNLTGITIPSSVTSIGDGAFLNCSGLTSITIPSSVTFIDTRVFFGCNNLTSIIIPSSVTSIGSGAFSSCKNLTNITADINNQAFSSIDGVLFDKSIQTIIAYPAGKSGTYSIPSSVTSIGDSAFSGCDKLTNVTIPSSVTSIGDSAFQYSGLTSITVPSSITSIGRTAFFCCYSLTNILIPSSVTSIGDQAFDGCDSLTLAVLSRDTRLGYRAFTESTQLAYW